MNKNRRESKFNNKKQIIKVIDAPCGYGKTEYAIQYMKKNNDKKRFIFVTPFLTEVDRIIKDIPDFVSPSNEEALTKREHIKELLLDGENIVTTHALFKHFDKEILGIINRQEYELILDEVMGVLEMLQLGKDAIKTLIEKNKIEIEKDTHLIKWIGDENYLDINPNFTKAQKLIQKKSVYEVRGKGIVWTLPTQYFKTFSNIYILTYMFNCQQQAYYYKANGFEFEKYSVKPTDETKDNYYPNIEYELVDYEDRMLYDKHELSSLINIYDGKINTIGQKKHYSKTQGNQILKDATLSSSWYEKATKKEIDVIGKNLHNYFTNITKSKNDDRLWTCKKGYKKTPDGKSKRSLVKDIGDSKRSYSKFYIPLNSRGTNEFQDRFNVAYLANMFMNPMEVAYFNDVYDIKINQDMWALSELIQFIYRSRIRQGQSINLYIPSIRMRGLLKWWLNQDEI